MDCNPPGSSVHGIFQVRILEWVAIPSSRGSSQPRDQTQVSYTAGGFPNTHIPTGEKVKAHWTPWHRTQQILFLPFSQENDSYVSIHLCEAICQADQDGFRVTLPFLKTQHLLMGQVIKPREDDEQQDNCGAQSDGARGKENWSRCSSSARGHHAFGRQSSCPRGTTGPDLAVKLRRTSSNPTLLTKEEQSPGSWG